ncbi:MAG: DNA-binding response regulator KdpE [uncultured Paraburkholderia sp.]|nr:MAG: DNA-binding response regulator KdpE [uncultured Paraburkholderia sp.]
MGAALRACKRVLAQHPVQVKLADDLPLLHLAAVLMERLFSNLFENAAKYTAPNTPLTIGAQRVEMDGKTFVRVSVDDDGPGLPSGMEARVFEKFTRSEKESAKPGLGLAICRAIVEAHGGTIGALNRVAADGRVEGHASGSRCPWIRHRMRPMHWKRSMHSATRPRAPARRPTQNLCLTRTPHSTRCPEIPMSDPSLTVVLIEDEKQIRRFVRAALESEKVVALDAGADDYLTKPFGVSELLARIRAHMHRRNQRGANESPQARFGSAIHLTPIEYRLLATLVRHAGRVLTHRQLLRDVWGPSHVESHHYLRIYMAHLRGKLERDPAQPEHIVTETGVGYRLVGAI